MNHRFIRGKLVDSPFLTVTAEAVVDGVPLRDLVAAAELPFAAAEGHPKLAGQYAGVEIYDFSLGRSRASTPSRPQLPRRLVALRHAGPLHLRPRAVRGRTG